ncbi:MAG: hypothetical protein HC833_14735 [Leptolyngbyaceae cyanobacterium RM1_406_9]|nr:hypothetical protein [Leptolyngbyaceae cyanobacterium RM1_406_9]
MKAHHDHSIRPRTIMGISLLLLTVVGGMGFDSTSRALLAQRARVEYSL